MNGATTDMSAPTMERLNAVAAELYRELHPRHAALSIGLDTSLEGDLGLDSLGRVELLGRIERAFDVALPERIFSEAETLRDLWRAVCRFRGEGTSTQVTTPAQPAPTETVTAEEVLPATDANTLADVLVWHAQRTPERRHIQFYDDSEEGQCVTFFQLYQGAQQMAAGLQQRGLSPGAAVAIMLPTGQDYLRLFMGILLAGGVPVPMYPPARKTQLEDHLMRHRAILANCRAPLMVTLPEIKVLARLMKAQVDSLQEIVTVDDLHTPEPFLAPSLDPSDTAFIQYTSGSTGTPKGVVLSHANLLANIRAMGQRVQARSEDVFVSWLPLYHDMGLIGAWLGSLYYGATLVLLSPLQFISRPQRWLWAIHRYGGTLSASPDFGYALCVRAIKDRALEGLDLSTWRAAFNGAEAINPDTMQAFIDTFASCGFRSEVMMPVFGLAENSVGLAFPPLGRGPRVDRVQREGLTRRGKAIPAAEDDATSLRFVACGLPLDDHDIRIADARGHELAERQEGRLQFRGPSSTSGYHRNPEATQDLFQEGWLDSGDLAYMVDGEIYITGRRKDLIIRAGRNIYPVELEEAIGEIPEVRTGNVAVFGTPAQDNRPEQLIVVAEVRTKEPETREAVRQRIQQLALDHTSIPADEVVLAEPGTVLKTSSGKIRRTACRDDYLKGRLGSHRSAGWQQWVRLALSGVGPELRRQWQALSGLAFAAYGWSLFYLGAVITVLGLVLLPKVDWRWALARSMVRGLRWATRTPVLVQGVEHLPRTDPCIVVANHMSYLDSYLLVATLPRNLSFVAKAELKQKKALHWLLRRIDVEFVERFDPQRGVEDASRLGRAAQQGRSLLFFAEGTFSRVPGLRPFRMGAFMTAANAGLPVIPVALRGTRSMLRAESWFPRRGHLHVRVGAPIATQTTESASKEALWNEAIRLRDQTRAHILRHCGEPDLEAGEGDD